ncbi:MAG: YdjY domain-containing protein [Gemmataceae bacterium]
MNRLSLWVAAALLASFVPLVIGCKESVRTPTPKPKPTTGESKKVPVGTNIWLEVLPDGSRQVVLSAEVCLTKGPLELLLTRKNQKEHEAILAAEVDARKVHEALLLAGAKPGEPVRFAPSFVPATGTRIDIDLVYTDKGTTRTVPAQEWIRNIATKKQLEHSWVFAGSMLVEDPFDPKGPKRYLANEGDVINVANFESAMLDLPVESSKADDSRGYEAWEERIPPEGTKVAIILKPVLNK